ncbi:hypothetical protein CDAR_384501 [Caerostris darwini]|uniref:Uncharacterized protein n=1 Tax=Caerostris darwini TaxID=1538125 RepID=A0AAV4SLE4_9ARAC|nr:hypothetical protein CDAR_583561 [Caerostris darwini]GIY34600.1 hypothetical protein CDAR_384501 [Caerostris darwini]
MPPCRDGKSSRAKETRRLNEATNSRDKRKHLISRSRKQQYMSYSLQPYFLLLRRSICSSFDVRFCSSLSLDDLITPRPEAFSPVDSVRGDKEMRDNLID